MKNIKQNKQDILDLAKTSHHLHKT